MKLRFLGTGTSNGVPVIGCNCKVCRSHNKKNRRYRSSAFITTEKNKCILIDVGPEFRLQAVENKISTLDAVLLTHSHADHLHGIDDLRTFSCDMIKPESPESLAKFNAPPVPIYTNTQTIQDVKSRFSYLFAPTKAGGGRAKIQLQAVSSQFELEDLKVTPIPMLHGTLETTGWLLSETWDDSSVHSIAYLTDCSYISPESFELIKNNCGILEHLVIDALRIKPHSTHFNFLQAMEAADKLNPKHVWFTHMTHNASHNEVKKYIRQNLNKFENLKKAESVNPAYDRLEIKTK